MGFDWLTRVLVDCRIIKESLMMFGWIVGLLVVVEVMWLFLKGLDLFVRSLVGIGITLGCNWLFRSLVMV